MFENTQNLAIAPQDLTSLQVLPAPHLDRDHEAQAGRPQKYRTSLLLSLADVDRHRLYLIKMMR
jgi:hypothetical protein